MVVASVQLVAGTRFEATSLRVRRGDVLGHVRVRTVEGEAVLFGPPETMRELTVAVTRAAELAEDMLRGEGLVGAGTSVAGDVAVEREDFPLVTASVHLNAETRLEPRPLQVERGRVLGHIGVRTGGGEAVIYGEPERMRELGAAFAWAAEQAEDVLRIEELLVEAGASERAEAA
jgi:hypothetical protein